MAITTLAGAVSGAQWTRTLAKTQLNAPGVAKWVTGWGTPGHPAAGSFDTTLNGVTLDSTSANVTGQIPFSDPPSGNTYLSVLRAAVATITSGTSQNGILVLADRLWHNGGFTITSTSAQSITSPTWPARDAAGATNGLGVLLGLELSAGAGAAAPTITVTYTNEAGTGSRTATNYIATASSPNQYSFFPLGLQDGDQGVRSVQDLTLSASWITGTINLVAFRPIAFLPVSSTINAVDPFTGGFPRLFNGSVPFVYLITGVNAGSVLGGSVVFSQG